MTDGGVAGRPRGRGADRRPGPFTAGAALLGYQYQLRYALLLLLRAEPGMSISMEKTDDVSLGMDEAPTGHFQTKHHANGRALGDASPDLWKTLHNWSVCMRKGNLDPSTQTLTLVTTSPAGKDTAASMLGPLRAGRNVKGALGRLLETARTSKSAANRKYYGEFAGIGTSAQEQLLGSTYILSSEPDIGGVEDAIRRELKTASPEGKQDALVEAVEGWWFARAIRSLMDGSPIPYMQLKRQIDHIRDGFAKESLPTQYADAQLPRQSLYDERTFIRQLKIISVQDRGRQAAKLDYYRAYRQRSKWVADDLIFIEDLDQYDGRLYEMWYERFGRMEEELEGSGNSDDDALIAAGRDHYRATIDTDMPIRPGVPDRYVARGSLHMLADDLRIGWHPNYVQKLGAPRGAAAA